MKRRRNASPLQTVLIANRGEIALRILRSLRVLGIRGVIAHSDVDADSVPVRLADGAECLGSAPATESYLRVDRILDAARRADADAIHPGYGFLAESSVLADAVESAGLVYLGPTPQNIALLGDKARAREVLRAAGIPGVPGSDGPVRAGRELRKVAEEIGFPLLIKAVGGGGGRGIRIVWNTGELDSAFGSAASEASSAFGSGDVLVERYVLGARHVEVQVLGDGRGGVRLFVDRDCSTQRRLQKLLEETPCPVLAESTRERLLSVCGAVVSESLYRSLGTFEFLLSEAGELFFLEVNTRIQVEHPITECVSDTDLVAEQIRVAGGETLDRWNGRLEQHVAPWSGAAIEFRVNAEDPRRGFLPSSGVLDRVSLPAGPGVRIDTALESGSRILPYYDPLIAKVIGFGSDRGEALARLRGALVEMEVGPLPTTLALGRRLVQDADLVRSLNHCQWLEERMNDERFFPGRLSPTDLPLAAAAAAWQHHAGNASQHAAPERGDARPTHRRPDAEAWRARSRWGEEA